MQDIFKKDHLYFIHTTVLRESSSNITSQETNADGSEEEEENSLNADELIAAVSASAEQGIALFSQWLGLNLNPARPIQVTGKPQTSEDHASNTTQSTEQSKTSATIRMARNMNLASITFDSEVSLVFEMIKVTPVLTS